ncbi:uncharacterized protein [Rutidosis leptorrhynchoides]|uniref:uncharacterized protein isoform X4 n=1 Tax=Rutidosis leptorrhynchoides TaxID=125765 RepID=UPI003A98D05F
MVILQFTKGIAKCIISSDIYFNREFSDYVRQCIYIGDGFGGLAQKALETYETYFTTKLKFITGEKKGLIPETAAESCCFLAICMKNINVEHVDYVFEMIFKLDDDNIHHPYVFLDSLFEKLKSCWPSFKLSSGAQLGRHPIVVDVDTFIELEKPLKMINKSNKSEDALKWKEEEEEDCKEEDVKQQQFGTSNSTNLYNNTTNTYDDGGCMDVRIYISASTEFEDLKTKISQRFDDLVSDNDYRVTYSLRGLTRPLWIELESDQDLKKCISLCRSNEINQLPIRIIPLVQHAFRPKSRHALLEIFPQVGGSPASHICCT